VTDGTNAPATIHIDRHHEIGRIDRNIYGHFLESNFFGNIEGGVFDEGSPLSISEPGPLNGMRRDVIAACRELELPVVRWPGGNFTSAYHWEDGIGPRDDRPRRLDLTWGGEESNRFGTDEFLAWCEAVGTAPYLAHGCRSVDDAVRWVEYTNYGGDTAYTRRRKDNGRDQPWDVPFWGVGNEVYGPWQMGHRSAEQYAWDAREHARFMRQVDPDITLIGVGLDDEHWTEQLLQRAGSFLDYLSIHLYGGSSHLYGDAGQDGEYAAIVAQSIHFEEEIRAYSDMVGHLARRAGIDRPLALAMDEWNMRHLEPAIWPDAEPGNDGGIAPRDTPSVSQEEPGKYRVNRYSPRTLADALFYAGVFHALHRLSGLDVAPTMANTVNLVNANALLAVRPDGLVKTATYHVWSMFQKYTGPIAVRTTVEAASTTQEIRRHPVPDAHGRFRSRPGVVPYLDATASLGGDRETLHLSVINRHPTDAIAGRLLLDGAGDLPRTAHVRDLGAESDGLLASNTMAADRVAVRDAGETSITNDCYNFPAHSLTALTFRL
jgi:alpha-L-arabinofuranosidase